MSKTIGLKIFKPQMNTQCFTCLRNTEKPGARQESKSCSTFAGRFLRCFSAICQYARPLIKSKTPDLQGGRKKQWISCSGYDKMRVKTGERSLWKSTRLSQKIFTLQTKAQTMTPPVNDCCRRKVSQRVRKQILTAKDKENIRYCIDENPDVTIEEIWEKLNLSANYSTVERAIGSMGYTPKKKSLYASGRDRVRCAGKTQRVERNHKA